MIHFVNFDEIVWPRRGLIIKSFGSERDIEICWHWRVPFSLPRYFDQDFGQRLVFARPRQWACARRDAWAGLEGGWLYRCHCCKSTFVVDYCYRCRRPILRWMY